MTVEPDVLEQRLADDIRALDDVLADESFCEELYRGLAGVKWHHEGGSVALSWKRADELVNAARTARGWPELTLAQTGGEGEASGRVAAALGAREWSPRALDTSRHAAAHVGSAKDPPPPETGGRQAPVDDPHAWERQAHAEADAERGRRAD